MVYRGDIYYIKDNGRNYGCEIDAGRPAVVVSNNVGNHHSKCCEVVYLTSQSKRPLPTHCDVLCRIPSIALCEQISTISQERVGEYIRSCTDAEMKEIEKCIMVSLGISMEESSKENVPEPYYPADDATILKLETERDTYKHMYESLLERMMK